MTASAETPSHHNPAPEDSQYIVPYLRKGSLFGQAELNAIAALLASDRTLSCGQERASFEEEFCAYLGANNAIALTSCTTALECATYLLNLQPGDEVIVQPSTYQATALPLLTRPVTVRWCDVNPNTLAAEPDSVASLITPRTRAIYLTHYGGLMADMARIMSLADQHGVKVVEDCAHALGSTYCGHLPGTLGDIGCFSFQSMKNISTLGQGGMLTCKDDRWASTVRRMRATEPHATFTPRRSQNLGPYLSPRWSVDTHQKNAFTHDCQAVHHRGMNATLSEPAAAVGRAQLRKLAEFVDRRRMIAERLNGGLHGVASVRLQREPAGYRHSYHLYTFFVDATRVDRNAIVSDLVRAGIEIELRYFPLHLLPEWRIRGHEYGECPVFEKLWFESLVNLPCYPELTDGQVDYMVAAVKNAIDASEPERGHA